MKKILILMLTLVLFACSNNTHASQITNGEDVLYSGPNTTFTKNDLYSALKGLEYDGIIMTNIIYRIAELENMDLSEFETNVESTMDMYKQLYSLENFDDFGGDDYFKKQLIVEEIKNEKAKEIATQTIDEDAKVDVPVKAKFAYFDDKDSAQSVIDAINAETTFEMAAAEAGYGNQIVENIYLDSDQTLPLEVKEYINSTTANGLSPIILTQTSTVDAEGKEILTDRYYLIDITSKDYKEFLDEYLTLKAETIEENEIIKYIIKDHDIKFYDEDTKKLFDTHYEGVFE